MDQTGHIIVSGPVWTSVDQCGPVWTSVDQCGPVWTSVDQSGSDGIREINARMFMFNLGPEDATSGR